MIRRTLLALALMIAGGAAQAHTLSDAELRLHGDAGRATLNLTIPLQDLAQVLPLDADGDGLLRWGEVQAATPSIASYVQDRISLSIDGLRCRPQLQDVQISDYHGAPAGWFQLATACPWPASDVTLDYQLLFDWNPAHRGVLIMERSDGRADTFIAAPERKIWNWQQDSANWTTTLLSYLRAGVHHIWIGLDHLLFVLVLLLPTALNGRQGPAAAGQALRRTAWLVTAFTIAHSLTLGATVLGWLQPPGAWIELAIAASIAVAALNNIFSWVQRYQPLIAFGFGLLHGFGFAAVLRDFGLPDQALALALLGFNLGVEFGQLALVALALPMLLLLARHASYRPVILQGGSAISVAIAAGWMIQRV